jgi:hypothetical protein
MDLKFLAHTVKRLIVDPGKGWDIIYSEKRPASLFKRSLFFPLLILASISAFLGEFFFANTELSVVYSVMAGIKYFITITFVVFTTAFILKSVTDYAGTGNDFDISIKLVICSVVPLLLCQILSKLFESFIFVNILSFYGIYILYEGMAKMLKPSESRNMVFMIVTVAGFIALFILANRILTLVTNKLYFSLFA